MKRTHETRYFGSLTYRDPKKAVSRGFPKTEEGGIERATGNIEWTVMRGPKVRGVNIYPVVVIRGDDDKPGRTR